MRQKRCDPIMAQRSARARANAAFANWSGKQAIWAQCMQGEGYEERVCTEDELPNPSCKVSHVY
jgi:hypothetical protein